MPNPDTTTSVQATDTGTTATAVATKTVKPGYKTTEGILAAIATLLSLAYTMGLLTDGSPSPWAKGAAFLAAALTSLGYSVSRGLAKH